MTIIDLTEDDEGEGSIVLKEYVWRCIECTLINSSTSNGIRFCEVRELLIKFSYSSQSSPT